MSEQFGQLSYFGLPSSSLDDLALWNAMIDRATAVERGVSGREWVLQNELLVNAFRLGISQKLTLLRGDIDDVLASGTDAFGHKPSWPFDIVSLDYSGGIFYRSIDGVHTRLDALRQLFQRQKEAGARRFVLLLSFKLDNLDQHEIRESIKGIKRDLRRSGHVADKIIDTYLAHPQDQPRLKLYVLHLVNNLSVQANYDAESEPPIFYKGNRDVEMMAFRFFLTYSPKTFAPRLPKERLNQIVNRRMIEIRDGRQISTNLGIPLMKFSTSNEH